MDQVQSNESSPRKVRILGIDPGSRVCGFAILDTILGGFRAVKPKVVDAGVVRLSDDRFLDRIGSLYQAAHKIVAESGASICVLEESFVGKNTRTAIKLGQARGALIGAAVAHGLHVDEITPAAVKSLVTGQGRADKAHIAAAVTSLCGFKRGKLPFDATDAVAIAIAYTFRHRLENLSRNTKPMINGRSNVPNL